MIVSPRNSTHPFITPLFYPEQSQITEFETMGIVPSDLDPFDFANEMEESGIILQTTNLMMSIMMYLCNN